MSRSISELLKQLAAPAGGAAKETELVNPDIPELDEALEIRDMYYDAFKLTSQPRNGTGYVISRSSVFRDPRKEAFFMDNSIDPNIIRAQVDPDSSHPNLHSRSLQSYEPESVIKPQDQVSLIKLSRTSEYNYANRFQPDKADPLPVS